MVSELTLEEQEERKMKAFEKIDIKTPIKEEPKQETEEHNDQDKSI